MQSQEPTPPLSASLNPATLNRDYLQNNPNWENSNIPTGYSSPKNTPNQVPDQKQLHTLAEKRSFLVRMVSDPKCYNPKIVRHLNMRNHKQMSQEMFRDRTIRQAIEGSLRIGSKNAANQFKNGKCKY